MRRLIIGALALLLMPLAFAGKAPVFATGDGAIRGYDSVAYFIVGQPTKGSDHFTAEYMGATFKFASAENRDIFKANPSGYAPQYGGYCAYAVSKGSTASTEPDAWTIVGDKLYLNYSLRIRKSWRKDIPGHIKAADKNWPGVLN